MARLDFAFIFHAIAWLGCLTKKAVPCAVIRGHWRGLSTKSTSTTLPFNQPSHNHPSISNSSKPMKPMIQRLELRIPYRQHDEPSSPTNRQYPTLKPARTFAGALQNTTISSYKMSLLYTSASTD